MHGHIADSLSWPLRRPLIGMVRLYIGGLQEDTTSEMLEARFTQFGAVSSCELPRNKPGCTSGLPGACRGFAYVELEPTSEQGLHRCLSIVRHICTLHECTQASCTGSAHAAVAA